MTPKRYNFCLEYLIDFNATQAAIRAKFSPHSARWIGYELKRKPFIEFYIKELIDRRIERVSNLPAGFCFRGKRRTF